MRRFFTLLLIWNALTGVIAYTPAPNPNPAKLASTPAAYWSMPEGDRFNQLLNDTIPPVITCPPNDTIVLAEGLCDTVYTYTVTAMDSLMPINPIQLSGLASGDTFPIGTTVNTFFAVDTSGNSSNCAFSVVVHPATTELTCQDTIQVFLGVDCWVAPEVIEALIAPYGCLNGLLIEADQEPPYGNGPWAAAYFDADDRNKIYSYRISDPATNKKCFGFVSIQDTIAPVLECPEIQVPCAVTTAHLAPVFLKDSLGIVAGMPLVTENCPGNLALSHVDVNMDVPCDTPGLVTNTITRFWTAVDASNRVGTCVQTISRLRSLNDISFPPDVTISCSMDTVQEVTGAPFVAFNGYQYSLLSAPFCEFAATYTDSIEPLCGGGRRLHRSWEVRDGCLADSLNNTVSGLQIIEIQDDLEPQLHCPQDTVVQILAQDCKGTIDLVDLVVSDACSYVVDVYATWSIDGTADTLTATLADYPGNNPLASDTLAVFDTIPDFPVGTTHIVFVATDACGNTGSCEIALAVWDSLPPTALCDSFLTAYLDDLGQVSLPASIVDDGSSDACGEVYFKVRREQAGTCDTLGHVFNDLLELCCVDLNDTVAVVLRVYDVYVPLGPVSDTLAAGQFSECTTPVLVLDTNGPQCIPPDTVRVLCENFDSTLATYGAVLPTCSVDSVAVTLDYQLFDSLCRQGTIIRTFQVFDKTGQSGQCSQQIEVENRQDYYVRFPDDRVITMCDTAGNYGEPEFFGVGCEVLAVSFSDSLVKVVPDACFRIERTWTIINWCTYDPDLPLTLVPNPEPNSLSIHPDNLPGPVVAADTASGLWAPSLVRIKATDPDPTNYSTFWSESTNGYRYKQTIKVIDIEQPEFLDCPVNEKNFTDLSNNDYFLWNANFTTNSGNPDEDLCEGGVDLLISFTDACFGPEVGIDFVLLLDLDGDNAQETAISSNELPTAGSVQYNNVNAPSYSGGVTRLFDLRPVVPGDKYQFGVEMTTIGKTRKARLVWHTPNAPGVYSQPQLPLGSHQIRWTIYDGCGNESSCLVNFRIDDPDGTCTPTEVTIGGKIKNEAGVGISDVAVQLDGTHTSLPAFSLFDLTDSQGAFDFSVPTSSSYSVTPFRNSDPLNGVSTFDLLLINKHVLGLDPLSSPYKIIAADANKSNTVTTFDIVEFRKLILGLYQTLPANTAWRFLPVGHAFVDPANPFLNGFPELQTINNLQQNNLPMHDFIGLKVGDVNGNAVPNVSGDVLDDRSGPTQFLELQDQELRQGDVITVALQSAAALAGFQFTLNYPGLELVDIFPGPGISDENFAVYNAEQALSSSWNGDGPASFQLQFRALETGWLHDMLQLSNRIARSEAYTSDLEISPLALRFDGGAGVLPGLELYQNRPNPFRQETEISFYLPEAKTATLRVWDAIGRLLWERTEACPAGFHQVTLGRNELGVEPGLLFYELTTDRDRAIRKMMVE